MKREEAIERLEQNKAAAEFYAVMTTSRQAAENELKDIEALNMAIEALSDPINCVKCKHYYETEEDSGVEGHCRMDTAHADIKRCDAIKVVSIPCGTCLARDSKDCEKCSVTKLSELINAIPSAQPKTGEWEEVEDCIGDVHYKCNKCGIEWTFPSGTPMENNANFCPNCGAEMRGTK